jgi:hypothetical protein
MRVILRGLDLRAMCLQLHTGYQDLPPPPNTLPMPNVLHWGVVVPNPACHVAGT